MKKKFVVIKLSRGLDDGLNRAITDKSKQYDSMEEAEKAIDIPKDMMGEVFYTILPIFTNQK
jgi:hypothetical protein